MVVNSVNRLLWLTSFFLFITLQSFGQRSDIWVSYYDKDHLFGYKNSKGEIMISPRFQGSSGKFDKIVALREEKDGAYESYYMLKNGKKFGKDSLYVFDMEFDCESEDMIKFRDPKTDQVGMFNEFGNVAIPAEYNDMTSFRNGLAIGLKNAKREYWDKSDNHSDCNHWSWVGGEEVLINKNNEILVSNFHFNEDIDLYSLLITDKPVEDSTRLSFLGRDGKYYSFIDNKKLFTTFLETTILNDLSVDNLIEHSYPSLVSWSDDARWTSTPKADFLKQNLEVLKKRLSVLKSKEVDYTISIEDFIPMPEHMYQQFDGFRDNCGNWNTSKYPIYKIVVTHKDDKNKFLFQDHFTFIKTDKQIQFISCSIRNAELSHL